MRNISRHGGVVVLAAALLGGAGTETGAQTPRETPVVRAVRKAQPAVVAVKVEKRTGHARKESIGTGILVDERGFAVTCRHVVASADKITVRLFDGTELPAQVVAEDAAHDLAVLRFRSAKRLPVLSLGPASDLMLGETVIAVGHPFGYTHTVSTGIVSAVGRDIALPGGEVLGNLIQTNASINPGSSGGPLLNINGEVIGLVVALREGAQGIAFALNADIVQQSLSRQLSAAKMADLTHGLGCAETVAAEGMARQRVVVREVAGPPTGLKPGDQLIRVGERLVANRFDLERVLWDRKPGDKVVVTFERQGKLQTTDLTLSRASANADVAGTSPPISSNRPR